MTLHKRCLRTTPSSQRNTPQTDRTDLKHILSAERLPFSLAYFGSLALTLWFAVGIRSTIGTLIAAIVQVVALLSYFAAYMPGGLTTLRFGGQMGEYCDALERHEADLEALRGAGSALPF